MGNLSHPKFFSKRDDDGGGNFKKNFDNKPFEASWRRNTFQANKRQNKGKMKVKSTTEKEFL